MRSGMRAREREHARTCPLRGRADYTKAEPRAGRCPRARQPHYAGTPMRRGCARRQACGMVLVITLVVLAMMSLAAAALMRAVDTATAVAGNLAFREASIPPANAADRGGHCCTVRRDRHRRSRARPAGAELLRVAAARRRFARRAVAAATIRSIPGRSACTRCRRRQHAALRHRAHLPAAGKRDGGELRAGATASRRPCARRRTGSGASRRRRCSGSRSASTVRRTRRRSCR